MSELTELVLNERSRQMTVAKSLDDDGELMMCMTHNVHGYDVSHWLSKEHAKQLVNHITAVFKLDT